SWFTLFRVVRAETLALREREFVLAARALGARPARILVRHVLPNVLSSVIALLSLLATNIILFETSLGFLGLGVPPPEPSWGGLIADGRDYIAAAWWISVLPGTLLALLALGLQLISEE
ncbi:MAG: ABC transporter permease, partial [Chloroflexi bacterium]